MDSTPLGAQETGAHLREIERQFGATGVQQSVRGLQHTRGASFANSAEEHAGFSPAARSREGGAIGERAATAIRASSASGLLPTDVREKLTNASGQDFDGVAIHDDAHAHRAAELLHARAFTVGRAIYFARNEYQPTTSAGMHLLAHEAAHTVQQQGQSPAVDAHALTTATGDRSEEEASHFADSVTGRHATAAPTLTPSSRTGLVHRAISFTHAGDAFTRNNVVATEIGGGFRLASDPTPSFQWDTNVTIHGAPGDPFANFEVGFHQVERIFGVNVHWGNGTNATHRNIRPDAPLPRRDATAAGNTWYNDGAPTLAAAFAANGDVRSPSFDDSPGTPVFPFANPVAGRVGNTGWFNYSDAFVTYLSARDTTRGTGAAAFRHIANVYWNLSAAGNFDGGRAAGTRVTLTTTGAVNTSRVMEGGSGEFPSMHGGIIANGHDTTTDT